MKKRITTMENINKNKAIAWVVIVIFLVGIIGYIGWNTWGKYKDSIIEKQKEQMMIISQSLSNSLEDTISDYAADLDYLSKLITLEKDPDMITAIADGYMDKNHMFIEDLMIYDPASKRMWNKNDHEWIKTFDYYSFDNDITMRAVLGSDKNIYFVYEKNMDNGLLIQLIVNARGYYEKIISNIQIGTNGYIVLKDADGVLFMHPKDEQLGKTVIEGRKELYGELDMDSLEELVSFQKDVKAGIKEYYSYWWTNKELSMVKKISAHSHVDCGDGFLIVSAVMDYDDIHKPLAAGFNAISLTFGMILLVLLFFATTVVIQIMQGRKSEQEIQYLKDLNQVLEETRRSEESIAHQQRLQIMGTMTGGIAHEFNNLLTPIMGYSEMLLDMLPNGSEEADYAKEIFDASDKAKDIIKQIAGLSRKNMETVFTFVSIKKALRRSLKMVRSVCPANISLSEDLHFEKEGFLGNETQFNQVLLNVCVNAFHAIGKDKDGIVKVTGEIVGIDEIENRHECDVSDIWSQFLCIKISDNGCGMEPEMLEHIFNPFFTTKIGGKGTGLGLSVVEQIIHSHNGYIFAESKVDAGSTFYIYFPMAAESDISSAVSSHEEDVNMRILAVDDNGKVLKLLERDFKKLNISITAVSNTEEAKVLLEKEKFDVMLVDQELSRTSQTDNGLLFAIAAGSLYPDLIKIIMTGQIKKELIEAKQHGLIESYIEKPVSDTRILEEIHKIIG